MLEVVGIVKELQYRLRLQKLGWRILAIVIFSELITGLALLGSAPILSGLLICTGVLVLLSFGVPGWGLLLAIMTAAPLDVALVGAPALELGLQSVALAIYAVTRTLDSLRKSGPTVVVFISLFTSWLLFLFLMNKIRFPAADVTLFSQDGEGVSIIGLLVLGAALLAGVFSKIRDRKELGLAFVFLVSVKIFVSPLPLLFGFTMLESFEFTWRSTHRLEYPGHHAGIFSFLMLIAMAILSRAENQLSHGGMAFLTILMISGILLTGSRVAFLSTLLMFSWQFVHSLTIRSRIGALLSATYLAFLVGFSALLLLFLVPHWGPMARFLEQGFVDDTRASENAGFLANLWPLLSGESAHIPTHNSFVDLLLNFGVAGAIIFLTPFVIALARHGQSFGGMNSILLMRFLLRFGCCGSAGLDISPRSGLGWHGSLDFFSSRPEFMRNLPGL